MKTSKRLTLNLPLFGILWLCLIMALTLTTSAQAEPNVPPRAIEADGQATDTVLDLPLPVTAGIQIGTPNDYWAKYDRSYFDEELGGLVVVLRLSDAGKLATLMSYCHPCWEIPENLAVLNANEDETSQAGMSLRREQALMDLRETLNELLVNAGGGPDYRYVSVLELTKAAKEVLQTEEYQRLITAAAPLAACTETDARSLMQSFTAEQLEGVCADLRAAAYGEWALRLQWLDEMEFSVIVPIK